MHINLRKKHILVTGVSRGIGKAIAKKLVECGAKVALQYNQNVHMAQKPSVGLLNSSFEGRSRDDRIAFGDSFGYIQSKSLCLTSFDLGFSAFPPS